MDIYGYMEFSNNEVNTATALELLSFAQIRVQIGLQMNFNGNIGRSVSSCDISCDIYILSSLYPG